MRPNHAILCYPPPPPSATPTDTSAHSEGKQQQLWLVSCSGRSNYKHCSGCIKAQWRQPSINDRRKSWNRLPYLHNYAVNHIRNYQLAIKS